MMMMRTVKVAAQVLVVKRAVMMIQIATMTVVKTRVGEVKQVKTIENDKGG